MEPRRPAQNVDAERALLGALLVDPSRVPEALGSLTPADFFEPKHAKVFAAISACAERSVGIDFVSVSVQLKADGELDAVGGRTFLAELAGEATSGAFSRHHARIVADASRLRQWAVLASEALEATGVLTPGSEASQDAQEALTAKALGIGALTSEEPEPIGLVAERVVGRMTTDRGDTKAGLQTGLIDLDRQLCGLRPGDFIVIAARPGMGKTAFATGVMSNALKDGTGHGLFASLEMGRDAIVERMVCENAGVSLHNARKYGMTDEDKSKVRNAEIEVSQLPLTIFDSPGQSPMSLRGMAQRVKHRNRALSLIVVDYLQLMRIKGAKDRYAEVSEISRALKEIAREFNVPLIALSQLSRSVEQRTEKLPQLSDLRESGSIEQDADLVLFLYRESYYNDSAADRAKTDVIIAKNRNGPTGKISVNFDADCIRFRSRESVEQWRP